MRRCAALFVATLLVGTCGTSGARAAEVDLSPASWPAGELARYTDLNRSLRVDKPQAAGREGMVVGTTGALAVRAGVEALRQGGTATDAALVTALTEVVLAAGSWVSFAGILSMVHYTAEGKKLHFVNGEYNTVLGETEPLSIPSVGPSGRTALVPGFMAAVETAHERFGRLPFRSLFEPAIYFAERGFPIDSDLAGTMAFRRDVLHRLPATREIFFRPNGSLYGTGDIFRQPQLAATLERVAERGAAHMYEGAWAERLVAALAAEGGRMTLEDLAGYRALVGKTKKARFNGFVWHGSSKPAAGGDLLAKTLRTLKKHDLVAEGHYTESDETLYQLMRATRAAYRSVPPLNHSDAVLAVDGEGNVAAVLHSINTSAWGETGIFVDGVSIPDSAAHQQQRVREAGPGNRIWTATYPVIVTRKRRPVLASSAIGSGLFEATVQSALNVLLWGREPKEAVETPVFRGPVRLADGEIGAQLVTGGEFARDLLDRVRARGIPIEERSLFDYVARGYWIGISIDPATGDLAGATTDLFNGYALGF